MPVKGILTISRIFPQIGYDNIKTNFEGESGFTEYKSMEWFFCTQIIGCALNAGCIKLPIIAEKMQSDSCNSFKTACVAILWYFYYQMI